MGDTEKLFFGVMVTLPFAVIFAVMAWKYWHGKWLASIAGNNFVTEEEAKLPAQRKLGKRMAGAMAIGCALVLALLGIAVGEFLGSGTLSNIFSTITPISVGVLVVYLIGIFTVQWRESRAEQNKELAANPSRNEDIKLDRRATVVLLVIFAIFLLCVLVVAPLAKT